MHYVIQEGAFDLPDDLYDQSVNVFTVTPTGASAFNIVITRSVAQTAVLAEHVRAEMAPMKQALVGFELLWERPHQLGGLPATIVASRIDGPNGILEQRQIFCLLPEKRGLTVTATAAPSFDKRQLGWLNDFAASFRIPQAG